MFEFFNLIKADLIQVNMQNDFVHIQPNCIHLWDVAGQWVTVLENFLDWT
jgi:hypothetical protein